MFKFLAPGCVVGFQFSHELMMERFMEITSKSDIQNLTCAFDGQDCYVIDNNGYIILSEERNDTGRFFGEVEGAIMESMVEAKIFKEIVVYDFQALCFKETYESSSANDMIFNVRFS